MKKADMPTPRYGLAASVVNGKIYAIGGRGIIPSLSVVEEYDPLTDTWTRKADMPTPRSFLGASVVDGRIYAIGGMGELATVLSTVEEYDPEKDTWTRKADMPTSRYFVSCSALDGKIYAIGGQTIDDQNNHVVFSTVEEYDPASDKWIEKADTLRARSTSSCAVDGWIYAIGGGTINMVLLDMEEYDPELDKWRGITNMPDARYSLGASVVDGKIYAVGGGNNRRIAVAIVEEYSPITGRWTIRANMPTPRMDLATSVVNGRIYAIGGTPQFPFRPLPTVEEYTPVGWSFRFSLYDKLKTTWGNVKADKN